jgi:hypothetical protein
MSGRTPSLRAFPVLAAFAPAYLHEDAMAEFGSPQGAVMAFAQDESAAEVERLAQELEALAACEPAQISRLLARLGCALEPQAFGSDARHFVLELLLAPLRTTSSCS